MSHVGNNPRFSSVNLTDFGAAGSAGTPAAGAYRHIIRNGQAYLVDSAGVETPVGSGVGEKNYIKNPDIVGATWVASGAGVTVATSTTAAELPESATKTTGIKITGVSGTDYVRARFTIDPADKAKKLKVQFAIKSDSAYVAGDFKIEVYTNTASNYGGTYTALPISPSAPVAKADSAGVILFAFDSSTADYYEVRVTRVSGTSFVVLSGVVVGPGVIAQSPAVGRGEAYSPTYSAGFGTVTGSQMTSQVVGEYLFLQGVFTTGTNAASLASFSLPSGKTIDSSYYTNNRSKVGEARLVKSGGSSTQVAGDLYALIVDTSTSSTMLYFSNANGAGVYTKQNGSTIANNGDSFTVEARIKIAELAGGLANVGVNDTQYAYNTDVSSTASVTASGFASGNAGVAFSASWTVGTDYTRRVRFASPKQRDESLDIWVEEISSGKTFPMNQILYPHTQQGTISYGWQVVGVSGSDTDFDVIFKAGGFRANSATYAQNGQAWSVLNTAYKWFAVKAHAGQAVGFAGATATARGLSFLPEAEFKAHTGNGFGSTATRRRRYLNVPTNTISRFMTYSDDSVNATRLSVVRRCRVDITVGDSGAAQWGLAIARNTNGTTNPGALTIFTQRLTKNTKQAGFENVLNWSGILEVSDVLEVIGDSAVDGTNDNTYIQVEVTDDLGS